MKHEPTCPKCQHDEAWVIDEMTQPEWESRNAIVPFLVVAKEVDRRRRMEVGRFAAWICARCGYTEWYARGFEALDELAAAGTPGVRRVRSANPRDPSR